jgi:uncharacterized protein (TIGR00369 family)
MNNPVLEFLKTLEGKTLEGSPAPVTSWLNGKLVSISLGRAVVEYVVRHEMTNPLGTLQGGIFTTMMDDTLGLAVYSLCKRKFYTTINFYTDYLGSAVENDRILVTAKIIRHGNTILNVGLSVENQDKKLLAKGNSNLVAKDIEGFVLPSFKGFEGNW